MRYKDAHRSPWHEQTQVVSEIVGTALVLDVSTVVSDVFPVQAFFFASSTMRIYRCLWQHAKVLMEERLNHYSQFNPSPLSVQQFADFGK